MIEVRNLTKRYRDLVAVDDLSFRLDKGEILGFLGRNGAGKSTTMKMLTGFMPPTSGTASIAGFDVFEDPIEVKRRVGYLPETPPLYLEMTVRGYLRFCADIKGVPRREVRSEIDRVGAQTSVLAVMDRLIGNLSKGFRQRVGIAQALIGSPDVLILDEPTSGLDAHQTRDVRDLVRSLAGQHTIIFSAHVMREVEEVCQKVLILHNGKLITHEPLAALRDANPGQSLEDIFTARTV